MSETPFSGPKTVCYPTPPNPAILHMLMVLTLLMTAITLLMTALMFLMMS